MFVSLLSNASLNFCPHILAALMNESNLLFAFAIKMHSLQSLRFRYQEVVRCVAAIMNELDDVFAFLQVFL